MPYLVPKVDALFWKATIYIAYHALFSGLEDNVCGRLAWHGNGLNYTLYD